MTTQIALYSPNGQIISQFPIKPNFGFTEGRTFYEAQDGTSYYTTLPVLITQKKG